MFHWCADETTALLAFLGMLPFAGPWLKAKVTALLRRFRKSHCCDEGHAMFKFSPARDDQGQVSIETRAVSREERDREYEDQERR